MSSQNHPLHQQANQLANQQKTHQQSQQQQQLIPSIPSALSINSGLTEEGRARGTRIGRTMFATMVTDIGPDSKVFLIGRGHRKELMKNGGSSADDPFVHMKIILREKLANPSTFLPGFSVQDAIVANDARRAVVHNILPLLLSEWRDYYRSWTALARAIKATRTLRELRKDMMALA